MGEKLKKKSISATFKNRVQTNTLLKIEEEGGASRESQVISESSKQLTHLIFSFG